MTGRRKLLLVLAAWMTLLAPAALSGQAREGEATPPAADTTDNAAPRIGHGDKGFEFESADGNFLFQFQARVQLRYSYPFDGDPPEDGSDARDQHGFKINRARLKIGGHGFRPWVKYYLEYELAQSALLDFRVMLEKWQGLRLKAGQWKAQYNRERVISSGKQQMLDRSITNRFFTIDRQQGVSLYGRAALGGAADFSYWASGFTGTGRGATENDDENLMWMGRVQWNFLGRELPFVGSDLERSRPTGLVAIGGVTNRSPYTAFSTSGGGQLPGFDPGVAGQYRVNQMVIETAFMAEGFAWQAEFHKKSIDDAVNQEVTKLTGGYAQVGYFPNGLIDGVPRQLEVIARYAALDDDREAPMDVRREYSFGVNWFFSGHLNKLTAEVGFLTDESVLDAESIDGTRFRFQWDVSF